MTDLWTDTRMVVLRVLATQAPKIPYEDRVAIAEDAARQVVGDVEWFSAN